MEEIEEYIPLNTIQYFVYRCDKLETRMGFLDNALNISRIFLIKHTYKQFYAFSLQL